MQTTRTTLPKLYTTRQHRKASPVVGAGYPLQGKLSGLRDKVRVDVVAVRYRVALRRYASADTALVGSRGEVLITELRLEVPHRTLDMYLSLQLVPEEGEADVWIGSHLLTLATLVVAVEDKLLAE